MADYDFWGRGFRFPLAVEDNQLASSSGEKLIEESIYIILGTSKGERVMRPDFGSNLKETVFAPNNTSTATLIAFNVKEALLRWEPRIEVSNINVAADREEPGRINIEIEYIIKTSNSRRNLVYPFYLEVNR